MIINLAQFLLNITRTVLLHQTDFSVVNFSKQLQCRILSSIFILVFSIIFLSKYRSLFLLDDPPPPFTPSLEIKPEQKGTHTAPIKGCQLSTRSLCKGSSEEVSTSAGKTHPTFLYQSFPGLGSSCKSNKSSDSLCEIKCIKKSNANQGRWIHGINLMISILTILLVSILTIQGLWTRNENLDNESTNSSSITYTNVVITPCGNYFWHSAASSAGSWMASDVAIKKEETLLEEASSIGVDWGYNGILGRYNM